METIIECVWKQKEKNKTDKVKKINNKIIKKVKKVEEVSTLMEKNGKELINWKMLLNKCWQEPLIILRSQKAMNLY